MRPVLFNDNIWVEIALQECDVLLRFNYRILNANDVVLCIAHTTQAAVTLQGEAIYVIPKDLKEALEKL